MKKLLIASGVLSVLGLGTFFFSQGMASESITSCACEQCGESCDCTTEKNCGSATCNHKNMKKTCNVKKSCDNNCAIHKAEKECDCGKE